MSWPLSQDFNEAIQNPSSAFADTDLKAGTIATNSVGMPVPRSGNYADVYQIVGPATQSWAVKCFTRPVLPDFQQRFAAITKHLAEANLPFHVGFELLPEGIKVRGKWYPVCKMQWVEGFPLNQFVQQNLHRANTLEGMLTLWVRLCRRLRETGMAHCDLQHGNVLLVPAEGKNTTLGLKLVDYDGMFVPALAGRPTGELGHAAYQHPERTTTNVFSADLDRFPHLVVATALRGLLIGGQDLWKKYDNGDNLLFREKDLRQPNQSQLMRDLWNTGDPFTVGLVGHLVLAAQKPLAQTPWLDQLMPGGQPPILTPSQERQAAATLGIVMAGAAPAPLPQIAPLPSRVPVQSITSEADEDDEDVDFRDVSQRRRKPQQHNRMILSIIAGVVVLAGIAGMTAYMVRPNKLPAEIVETTPAEEPPATQADPKPDPAPIDPNLIPDPLKSPPPVKPIVVAPVTTPVVAAIKPLWSMPVDDGTSTGQSPRFSADGSKIVVVVPAKNMIQTYDSRTGKLLASFKDHEKSLVLAASPVPGGRVISYAKDPLLFVWDDQTGKAIGKAKYPSTFGTILDFCTDQIGAHGVFFGTDQTIVFDLETGSEVLKLTTVVPPMGLRTAAISADGKQLLALTPGGTLTTRSLPSGEALSTATFAVPNVSAITAWSPERELAVVRKVQGTTILGELTILNTRTGQVVQSLPGEFALAACFTPNGAALAISRPGILELLDTTTWKPIQTATAPDIGTARSMDVAPNGKQFTYTGAEKKLHLIAFELPGSPTQTGTPTQITVAPANLTTLVADRSWPAAELTFKPLTAALERTGAIVYTIEGISVRARTTPGKPDAFRYTPPGVPQALFPTLEGNLIVLVRKNANYELHTLNGKTGAPLGVPYDVSPLDGGGTGIVRVSVSANGAFAAVVKPNGHVAIHDLKLSRLTETMSIVPAAVGVAFDNDATKVMVNRGDRVQVYLMTDLTKFSWAKLSINPMVVEDSSIDGTLVAIRPAAGAESKIVLQSLAKTRGSVSLTAGPTTVFRYLPDLRTGILLDEQKLQVIDLATGSTLATKSLPASADRLAIAPGGAHCVVAGAGHLSTWQLSSAAVAMRPGDPLKMPVGNGKPAVPDAASLAKAEGTVKNVYQTEFAKKLPADRRKLAERLIKDAAETLGDPAVRYVMLRSANELGVELLDVPLSLKTTELLCESYDLEVAKERVATLEKLSSTTAVVTLRTVVDSALDFVDEPLNNDRHDEALAYIKVAFTALEKMPASLLKRDVEARQTQIRAQRDAYEPVKLAIETLKTKSDDPAGNLLLGKYRCLNQSRWDEGLPHLAAGADLPLQKLAKLELTAATDPDTTDLKRGDAWRDYAQNVKSPDDRAAVLARAKFWYVKTLESNRGGIERTDAENKLSFTTGGIDYRPGLVAEYFFGPTRLKQIGRPELILDIDTTSLKTIVPNAREVTGRWTGVIVAPVAGKYRIVADTADAVIVRLGTRPKEVKVIDVEQLSNPTAKRDGYFNLSEKPTLIQVEYKAEYRGTHTFKLKWQRPGSQTEEVIPVGALYHSKLDEKLYTPTP